MVGALKFHCVTTMNEAGWRESGRRMAKNFIERWPAEASLTIYAEGFRPDVDGVTVKQLPAWLSEFKKENGATPSRNGRHYGRYSFKFDAVKFSHKVAALTDFGLTLNDGVMIWMDADTLTHANVTAPWLANLFPEKVTGYMAWLDRSNNAPECGFVMFRCGHGHHRKFMERFRDVYASGEVFKMAETHDSFVLQQLAMQAVREGKFPAPHSLSGNARNWHHPFVAGPLGERLDHMKGDRKIQGRSPVIDARGRREPHWLVA